MRDARRSRRNRWRAALGLLVAALLVDTVGWALACRRLDDGARDALQRSGWSLESAGSSWGGWPIAAAVTLEAATLRSGPEIAPPIAWRVPHLTLRIAATAPTQMSVAADGGQTVSIAAGPPVPFSATSLHATIDLSGQATPRIAAQALRIAVPGFPVRIDSATLDLHPDGWAAALAGIVFPGTTGQPIDPAVTSLHLDGQITPPIRAAATAAAGAADWRDRGGRLALTVPELRWGTLAATGNGTLTLDAALQPALDGTVAASGLAGALRQLAANGAVRPATATAAGAMLAILAAPSGDGSLDLPVTLNDGVLAVARFPLLRFPPLRWSD